MDGQGSGVMRRLVVGGGVVKDVTINTVAHPDGFAKVHQLMFSGLRVYRALSSVYLAGITIRTANADVPASSNFNL